MLLRITEPQPQFGRIIVADYLPAGFEIDNPRLVSSGDTGVLNWIGSAKAPTLLGIPRRPLQRGVRAEGGRSGGADRCLCGAGGVARPLCAAAAYIEDMYRPDRFGRTETGSIECHAK